MPIQVEHFFENGQLDVAIRAAAESIYGLRNAQFAWVETTRYMGIFHGVQPANKALQCADCHNAHGRVDWKFLGYEADPAEKK